jgi:hypothetical protein
MTSEETITRNLEDRGWHRQFIASEHRLSEAVEMYVELGFQVHLEPLSKQGKTSNEQRQNTSKKCRTCFEGSEDRYRIIFTKPAEDSGKTCSG